MTTSDLRSIANAGGGMILDARSFTTSDLRSIANNLSTDTKAVIILKNAATKTVSDLRSIANAGNGQVFFDFT